MRNFRSLPISTTFMLLVAGLAVLAIGYGLWSQVLTIGGRINTGNLATEFNLAFTDDDGVVDMAELDGNDTGDCPVQAGGSTSCDPAASGEDPKDRHDKDVASCKAALSADGLEGTVTKDRAYPGYFCTAWFQVHNSGNVPVRIARATIEGQEVLPSVVTPFDLNNDGQDDVAIHLTGFDVCQQVDPSQEILIDIDQQILQGAPEGQTLGYNVEVQFDQWNEECQPAGNLDGVINAAVVENAEIVSFSVSRIPPDAFSDDPFEEKPDEDGGEVSPPERIHPVLAEWLETRPGDERVRLVVNFSDSLTIPQFPEPDINEPRDSGENKAALARSQALVRQITNQRADDYERLIKELAERQLEVEVIDAFWLVKAMFVEMPLGAVPGLLEMEDVIYVEPNEAGEVPPSHDGNANNDVDDGRARIVSDPYFNLGLTGGWIGLLDSGIRPTHTLFNSPSNTSFVLDCTDGTCNNVPDPTDDCWNHGTSTAAIISGNNNLGNAFRGVTGVTLDSFKVYPAGCGSLGITASVQAFQTAVAILDRVIVAEMQGNGSDTSTISTTADNAFDAGAVIIAANGNNGPGASTVNTPANAHKVIGVGNFDVQTLNQINSQSRGAAPDNRYKPDIQAPTNTETASSASDTALRNFSGTSGATPYASGAAALLRNWLRGTSFNIDPGQVYAQLILAGQNPYPFNNTSGAGPIKLPVNGWAWWGKVTVGSGTTIDITLNNGVSNATFFDGALWWPETAAQSHNDIDLYLIDPNGVTRDLSWSIPSVFERARATGTIQTGEWKLRIRGYSVPTGSQTVYWAAAANSP